MDKLQDFLDFIETSETKVIERDVNHVIVKNYDMCMEYAPYSSTGHTGAASDIDVYGYEDYISQNITDLAKFKIEYFEEIKRKVTSIIRGSAPYTGHSALTTY